MTQPRDPDAIVAAWLEDGPVRLPRETRSAITVALRTQPRVRRMAVLGGTVTPMTRFATAAGVVLAVGLVSVLLLANRGGGPGSPQPSAVPSSAVPIVTSSPPAASPSTAASARTSDLISTSGWKSFTSNRYGYSIQYPPTMSPEPSTRQWTTADASDWLSPANDLFKGDVAVTSFAIPLPAGTTRDGWIASYINTPGGTSSPCTHTPVDLPLQQVDGQPVVFWQEVNSGDCGGTFAFVQVGNQLHAFFIGRPGYEPTLETMLSTVKFKA